MPCHTACAQEVASDKTQGVVTYAHEEEEEEGAAENCEVSKPPDCDVRRFRNSAEMQLSAARKGCISEAC